MSSRFLAEDGDLDPTAFIITAEDQILRPIELQDEPAKSESCKKIVDEARQRRALAIITVFLAQSKDFEREHFDEATYSWGDIHRSATERCILITISGPGIKNWAAALPFKLKDYKIVFGELVEFRDGLILGMFPGWSDQATNPSFS